MGNLISESIIPYAGSGDAKRMAQGEPGLPAGFTWRDERFEVVERLAAWKESSREGSHAQSDLYLRRHYYRLRMGDERVWVVYCLRQTPRSGNPKMRWFLYTME